MPLGDGTGPMGFGPMTGRGAGFCAGFPVPGFMNPFGFWGWGRGWRWFFRVPFFGYGFPFWGYSPFMTSKEELEMLKSQAEYLRELLSDIERRISEIEKER